MARKRIIDPDFWLDDTLANLSLPARMFYIGTWNFSDDYGVIENNPVKLKAQIFPYDDIKIEPLVKELVTTHRLLPFQAEDKQWFYIKNFLKWQKVEKPSQKRNPVYTVGEDSPTTPQPVGSEVKLREVKLREVNLSPTAKDEVNLFFNIFHNSINPNINFAHKGNRDAAQWLINKYGFEKACAAARFACQAQTDKYAPTITTPYQLKEKMSALVKYQISKSQPNRPSQIINLNNL